MTIYQGDSHMGKPMRIDFQQMIRMMKCSALLSSNVHLPLRL